MGKHSLGAPQKGYKDTLKGFLKSFNLNPDTWEQAAQNHCELRAALHNGAKTHERERTIAAEKRKQARKSNADKDKDKDKDTFIGLQEFVVHMTIQ